MEKQWENQRKTLEGQCFFVIINNIYSFHTIIGKKITIRFVRLYDELGRQLYYNKIIKTSG